MNEITLKLNVAECNAVINALNEKTFMNNGLVAMIQSEAKAQLTPPITDAPAVIEEPKEQTV